jgi:hypothetical protein
MSGYQPAPLLQAPPPEWHMPPSGFGQYFGPPVFQPVPAAKVSPMLDVPVQHQQVHATVSTRSKTQKTSSRRN